MSDLRTTLCGISLKNPVIAASGTFGYGGEFASQAPLDHIGAIAVKGLSRVPIRGNASPRVTETAAGMLNAIGLQNIGVKAFVADKLPRLEEFGVPIFANVFGYELADYVEVLSALEDAEGLAAYELNVSCPNTKRGGLEFGANAAELSRAVAAARAAVKRRPLLVKLSPNVTDIGEMARAAVESGADGLSLINTLRGLAVNARTRRPTLSTGSGGLSGPAIKPVALHMVHQVSRAVDVPIIGIGGIATAEDIVEFLLCGATAVQVGTASFWDPARVAKLPAELNSYLDAEGTATAAELTGALQAPGETS